MNYWAADDGAPQAGWVQPIATFIIEGVSRRTTLFHPVLEQFACGIEARKKDGLELLSIRVPCDTITAYHVGDELDVIHRPGSHS